MENVGLAVVAGATTGLGFYFVISALRIRGIDSAKNVVLFLITSLDDDATTQVETCEKLIRALASLRKTFTLEAVVPHVGDKIHFYIAVPIVAARRVERELRRLFGGFAVERIHDDHIVFYPYGAAVGAFLMQKDSPATPIPVYREIGADLFKDVLQGLSEVSQIGEGAAVQFVVNPIGAKKVSGFPSAKLKPLDSFYEVNVRVVASAGSEFRARDILNGIVAGFEKFRGPGRNALRASKPHTSHALILQFLSRAFNNKQKMLLTGTELASLYHIARVKTANEIF